MKTSFQILFIFGLIYISYQFNCFHLCIFNDRVIGYRIQSSLKSKYTQNEYSGFRLLLKSQLLDIRKIFMHQTKNKK
jgi:hypothetical protein